MDRLRLDIKHGRDRERELGRRVHVLAESVLRLEAELAACRRQLEERAPTPNLAAVRAGLAVAGEVGP